MLIELPVCKRCCFCLPLRYGLLVWGYLKLITSSLVLIRACLILNDELREPKSEEEISYRVSTFYLIVFGIAGIIALIDLLLTIAYIVGCYQKNVKLLRIYYFYSSFLVTLLIVFSLYAFGVETSKMIKHHVRYGQMLIFAMLHILILFANVALQIYILLLVRSEIVKLANGSQFRFVNNAAEAKCTLEVNNMDGEQEKRKENNGVDNEDEIRIYV